MAANMYRVGGRLTLFVSLISPERLWLCILLESECEQLLKHMTRANKDPEPVQE